MSKIWVIGENQDVPVDFRVNILRISLIKENFNYQVSNYLKMDISKQIPMPTGYSF